VRVPGGRRQGGSGGGAVGGSSAAAVARVVWEGWVCGRAGSGVAHTAGGVILLLLDGPDL
jgi:hypothetical protein